MSWRRFGLGLAGCRVIQKLAEATLILNRQLLDLRQRKKLLLTGKLSERTAVRDRSHSQAVCGRSGFLTGCHGGEE